MAKVNGPLLSLGATGQIGKALVYSTWKGLNTVRQHVVPANPNSTAQATQRGYMADAVDDIHDAQIAGSNPLNAVDVAAYALWANQAATPRTWFNQACKNAVDVAVAGNTPTVFRGASSTPGAGQVALEGYSDEIDLTNITAMTVYYGTSPTALINSTAATITGGSNKWDKTVSGLSAGTKYYFQARVDVGENCEGAMTGIFSGTPT